MKKLILYLITGTFINSVNAQTNSKSDIQNMKLTGKVKSLRETCYQAVSKENTIQKGKRQTENKDEKDSYIILNDNGNKTEKTLYNSDGSLFRKLTFQYNDKGNIIEEDRYNTDGSIAYKRLFSYKYDDKGNIIEKAWLKSDGNPESKSFWKYDDKGNVKEIDMLKADGSLSSKETYDSKGNLLEDISYKKDGIEDWKSNYKYDENENCIEQNDYKGTKFIIKYLKKYDERGNQVEINWCKENGKPYQVYFQKYEYDANGNWIRQIQFQNNKPTYLFEREVTYF